MAVNGQDIGLIFGLAGGGSIGGETGKHIRDQLATLVEGLNSGNQIGQRKLKFALDVAGTKKSLTYGLKQITDGLSGQKQFKIKLTNIDASAAINKLQSDIQDMLNKLSIKNGMTVSIDTSSGKIIGDSSGAKSIEEATEHTKEYNAQLGTLIQTLNTLNAAQRSVSNGSVTEDTDKIDELTLRIQSLRTQIEDFRQAKNQPDQQFVNNIVAETAALNQEIAALSGVTVALPNANGTIERSATELSQLNGLLKQVTREHGLWTKAASDPKTREAYERLAELATEIQQAIDGINNKSFAEFRVEVQEAERTIISAGNATQAWTDRIGKLAEKFSTWFSLTRIIMAAYRSIGKMVTNVIELDSAMTQLQIVTGASDAKMTVFLKNATGLANELGQSISDILKSIETFSRLGYNLEDSSTLAKFAAVMSNVAAVDTSEATTGITSIIKGFNMDVSNTEHVADVLIEVGQKYAVSAAELMEAFQRSGAALNATNTSFEKSVGLIAAANASIQNANTVGTALKTISARIRSSVSDLKDLGEDTEELADGFSKYAEELKALTGFDIMVEGTTNQFKDIYDILEGIANVWEHLSDTQQARVSEILGGTRQLQVISSILGNWTDATGAYQSAMESAGTATEANARYLESIEGKLGVFKATFQELSETLIGSDFVKQFVELGTGILNILINIARLIDAVGGLNTILGITSGLLITMNAGAIAGWITKLLAPLKSLIGYFGTIQASGVTALQFIKNAFAQATVGALTFQSVLGAIGIAITAITVVYTVYQRLHKSTEELRSEYDELQNEVKELNRELDSTKARIKELQELSENGTITLVEQEELDKLLNTNAELERQLRLQQDIAAEKAKETNKRVQKDYNKSYYPSIAQESAITDASAYYKKNADAIKLYSDAMEGSAIALEKLENLSDDEYDRVLNTYGEYQRLNLAAEYSAPEYLDTSDYAKELIARYRELDALGSGITENQAWQMEEIRRRLLELAKTIQNDYLDKYVGNDEFTAIWTQTANAIDACLHPAEHFASLLQELPGQVRNALETKGANGELTSGDVEDLASRWKELDTWMKESGYTADEVAAHYNALSRSTIAIADVLDSVEDRANAADVVEKIAAAETEVEKVGKVLGEFSENGAVSAVTLETLREIFGKCEEFQHFVDVMSDVNSTMSDAQAVSDALATEWINQLDLLSLVNEETAGAVEALLELTGVTNAHEVVEAQLIATRLNELIATDNLTDAIKDEVVQLLLDAGAAKTAEEALEKLRKAQFNAKLASEDLSKATGDSIGALYTQAKAAGASIKALNALAGAQELLNLKANSTQLELQNALERKYGRDAGMWYMTDTGWNQLISKYMRDAQFDTDDFEVTIPTVTVKTPTITGSGSGKTKKEVEAYIADIDRLYKKREALSRQELANSRLSDKVSNTDDLREKINLQSQYVQGLKNEQARLHDIAGDMNTDGTYNYNTARAEILENLEILEKVYGVTARYNPETNELLFEDLEQINRQVVEIKEGMTDSEIQEAINDKIKAAEDLVDTVLDQVDATKEWSAAWIDAQYAIRETNLGIIEDLKAIVEETSNAVDEIQNVYDTLQKAADEFDSSNGFISVDTFQEIMSFGAEYLQYLTDENGMLVINRQAINDVIKARTEQLAIENAMSYVERIRMALQSGAVESLDQLIDAQSKYNGTLWDTVYATLEVAKAEGLTDGQYSAAKHNVDVIYSLLAGVHEQFNEYTDDLNDAKDVTDKILKWTMDMLKKRVQDEIDSLEDLKDKYSELIQARKDALDMAKQEDDYQDSVLEKTKRLAELQGQIDLLALDDSRDAQAKRQKLMEEMADVQKELDELQRDHSIEQQKASLDEMQENYEDEKDEEIKVLEDSISSYQKIYDKAIDYINKHWDTLKDELIQWNYDVGNTIEDEITGNWEKAIAAMERYKLSYTELVEMRNQEEYGFSGWGSSSSSSGSSWSGSGSSTVGTVSSGSTSEASVNAVKAAEVSKRVSAMKDLAGQWNKITDQDTRNSLHSQAAAIAAELPKYGVTASFDDATGAWTIIEDLLNSANKGKNLYSVYHTGGIVGGGTVRENEQLALLQKGEPIISNDQKQTLFDLIDFMGIMRTKLANADFSSIDLISSSRKKQLVDLMAQAPSGGAPNIHFGDVYIYGGNEETVRKHQEISRQQANEVLKYLKIKV